MNVYSIIYVKGDNLKKIRFGSFPLIKMNKKDRNCLDSYLIKSFANKIAITTALGNINKSEKNYISPYIISKFFKSDIYEESDSEKYYNLKLIEEAKTNKKNKKTTKDAVKNAATKINYNKNEFKKPFSIEKNKKAEQITRAFKALKNLNANIIKDPFYRNNIILPIYIEGSSNTNVVSYDFLLLSNDLLNNSSIDEINYSDNITFIILFLKIIMTPSVGLGDIGTSAKSNTSLHFKSEVAKIIEFSQLKGLNPVTIMFYLLQAASKLKKKKNSKYPGFIEMTKTYIADIFKNDNNANEVIKFFGENDNNKLKSISDLLDRINFDSIHEFFDDKTGDNSHVETGAYADPIFRQYMLQKVEQYNSVLSLLNALYDFNNDNNLYIDVNKYDTMEVNINNNNNKLNIKHEDIIDFAQNNGLPCFMINLRNEINAQMKIAVIALQMSSNTTLKKNEKLPEDQIQAIRDEINSLTGALQNATQNQNNQDIQALTKRLEIYQKSLNAALHTQFLDNLTKTNQNNREKELSKINLSFNLNQIQNEISLLYSTTLVNLLNAENIQKILNSKDDTSETNFNTFYTEQEDIINNLYEKIKFSIEQEIKNIFYNTLLTEKNQEVIKATLQDYDNIAKNIFDNISDTLQKQIKKIYQTCFYDNFKNNFKNDKIFAYNKIMNTKQEQNVILKSLSNIDKTKNFKSFTITEKILTDLYQIVYYYDSLRYIGGLINTPPSTKIFNHDNQLKYIIKRLGLHENIIYILGTNHITLQMPDFLSLTGSAIFEKIPFINIKEVCSINWERDLYDDPKFGDIFGESKNETELKNQIASLNADIKNLEFSIKKENDIKKKNNLQIKLDKLREDLSYKNMEKQNSSRKIGVENLNTGSKNLELDNLSMQNNYQKQTHFKNLNDNYNGYNSNGYNSNGYNRSGHGFSQNLGSDIPQILNNARQNLNRNNYENNYGNNYENNNYDSSGSGSSGSNGGNMNNNPLYDDEIDTNLNSILKKY